MAASVVTVSILEDDATDKIREVIATLAIAAGDYVAGGLDIATPLIAAIAGQTDKTTILDARIAGIAGYVFEYVKSTGKLQVRNASAAGPVLVELAAAATPAALVVDIITATVKFRKFA